MSIKIAATKTNLLKTRRTLELCREGYQLLDEKRKILLMEISSITGMVEKIQKEAHEMLARVYQAAEKALVSMGKTRIEYIVPAVDSEFNLEIKEKKTMGATVPEVSFKIEEHPPFFSPAGISQHVDEAIFLMRQALEKIIELAEKNNTLLRLEQEFHRTTKKVNALEKIHIPYYSELVRNITERLDEESREAFATLKEIKKRIS